MADIKKTARAIIFNEQNQIILIKRIKYDKNVKVREYYVFPGGHLDEKETFEQAVVREVFEELGINVKIVKEIAHSFNNDLIQDEVFFECSYINGVIGTGTGEEWSNQDVQKYGSYEIYPVSLEEFKNINVLPVNIKKIVMEIYKNY